MRVRTILDSFLRKDWTSATERQAIASTLSSLVDLLASTSFRLKQPKKKGDIISVLNRRKLKVGVPHCFSESGHARSLMYLTKKKEKKEETRKYHLMNNAMTKTLTAKNKKNGIKTIWGTAPLLENTASFCFFISLPVVHSKGACHISLVCVLSQAIISYSCIPTSTIRVQ